MSELTNKIRSKGHWMIAIHPAEFAEDRVPYEDLDEIIPSLAVRLRGWPVPYANYGRHERARGEDWVGQEVDAESVAMYEAWRFFTSGLFTHLRSVSADWRTGAEATCGALWWRVTWRPRAGGFAVTLVLHGSPPARSSLRRVLYYEFRPIEVELALGPPTPEYLPPARRCAQGAGPRCRTPRARRRSSTAPSNPSRRVSRRRTACPITSTGARTSASAGASKTEPARALAVQPAAVTSLSR